jgi:hypothetical protein
MLRELMTTGKAQWVYHSIRMNVYADRLESFLANKEFQSENGAIVARFESFGMEFGGHRFDIGAVQFYGPKMRLRNMADLRAAVGTGLDPEARWECNEGEHIYVQRLIDLDGQVAA